MINNGINNVPDKTIALFVHNSHINLKKDRIFNIIKKNTKKRDWFTSHFYRCLPLTIGNQYGFSLACEFDFSFEWNGGDGLNDIIFEIDDKVIQADISKESCFYPRIESHFGSGIITMSIPISFRTPPGINLMTINPPNYVIPNITVMTGVIETDNLRYFFTFNLKVQIPNMKVFVPAGTPLTSFIPIPRYFADSFELKMSDEIFSKEIVDEEIQAMLDSIKHRLEVEPQLKNRVNKNYMLGRDIYHNKFKDHQGS